VEERQGGGFEEGSKFGRIQKAMEGHQYGSRRVPIERDTRDQLHGQRVYDGRQRVALLLWELQHDRWTPLRSQAGFSLQKAHNRDIK
jgi:hypothetical protein